MSGLSKSRIEYHRQCSRRLWLEAYRNGTPLALAKVVHYFEGGNAKRYSRHILSTGLTSCSHWARHPSNLFFSVREIRMKFEMGNNDCQPMIEVVAEGDELVVRFWGFAFDEARQWFHSEPVMDSFKAWHSLEGDFVMSMKVRNPIQD